ncbi:Anaerobic selenocysteine-containing dehydrogenase [Desulfatibacillum alkenivorans DSM 16219]|jgi:anaerobic selenocysteine-containing dehydrogenase|uniref:Anaerobic selenocysteine-containing dehydrogenase n=1 Tax=Desulfatibacillum alkenivorans DSM 16219 TaxID=1121393 RepID=A0A1M6ZIB2_9BACT|nr:molybdopterin-dependent oxidoreductase [Desulfatibacillum alkenivorans]SHL30073.1 Anaerobic selenocysteine-containing dehydrogenase [Desulfatibacillum alkenivorans DSM 16219]
MGKWHKSGCVLCAQNCGLELLVEDGKIVKSRPDKDNPRSQGYACRKGLNVRYHQYPKDRLTEPLKKVNGKFEPISWDQAISEIAEKMQAIHKEHGPRALAYMGGSAQGGHLEATFGLTWLRNLGSRYYYSSAGQEFSDSWWLFGRMLGKQYNLAAPDEHAAEVLIAWGWNGMMSHQMPQARKTLRAISKDPDKMLIAVDPRKSETAAVANMHVAVRPGADALLLKAMIAIIVEKGWEKTEYIQANVEGWDGIKPWFEGFDYKAAIEACELDIDQVMEFCRILAAKKWCVHPDLGLYMGRKGVYSLYLLNILAAICGRFGVRGGNVIPGFVVPMGFHADERDPKTWRTMATDMPPAAAGSFPPAVMPEEILSDHPQKLRAVYVSAVNPLRSYPDSQAYEEAFNKVDLLVVNDIAMTETARLADYVLPCRTFYESCDGTFFPNNFPEVFFQIRKPIVEPPPLCRESSQITTMLADKMGLIPEIPDELHEAAKGDRLTFGAKLMEFAGANPDAMKVMPFVLAKTLGEEWDSAALAAIWGLFMTAPKAFRKNAARAGFEPGLDMGDRIFQALMDNPQGLWVGKVDPDENLSLIKTPSGKVEVFVPELEEGVKALDAQSEAQDMIMPKSFPLILHAGRHMDYNANTLMRNPDWNKGKRACTVAVHPGQAEALGLKDGQQVEVFTEAGSAKGELQISDQIRQGTVLIPHGFGLQYGDEAYGLNVNHLTKNTHRSTLGTPIHRFVPCRVEAV